jgi:hypothetical protein
MKVSGRLSQKFEEGRCAMSRVIPAIVCSFIGLLLGCSVFVPEQTRYLNSAVDHATREEVRQHLGEPRTTSPTQTGEMLWLYEIRELEPGSQSSWSTAGSWCDEYRLVFDQAGVLRHWTHHSYFHGGEVMPVSCNSAVGVEKQAL